MDQQELRAYSVPGPQAYDPRKVTWEHGGTTFWGKEASMMIKTDRGEEVPVPSGEGT